MFRGYELTKTLLQELVEIPYEVVDLEKNSLCP